LKVTNFLKSLQQYRDFFTLILQRAFDFESAKHEKSMLGSFVGQLMQNLSGNSYKEGGSRL
ncbi:MAG: hypothetical protein MR871_14300, partial [Lachnospiraceae bacterium]|nr:hypothetical protein [Lachnospiraceae bacterium]